MLGDDLGMLLSGCDQGRKLLAGLGNRYRHNYSKCTFNMYIIFILSKSYRIGLALSQRIFVQAYAQPRLAHNAAWHLSVADGVYPPQIR